MLIELVGVFLTLFVARADTATDMTYITPTGLEDDPRLDFTVRLHLVRHGEAEGNIKNLVLGQVESVSGTKCSYYWNLVMLCLTTDTRDNQDCLQ